MVNLLVPHPVCPKAESRVSKRCLYAEFIAALRTSQEAEATHVSTVEERTSKMWCIHTKECHSALKRKEILTRATTWMRLGDVRLSEASQTREDEYCVI